MASPPNPTSVPTVTNEYMVCLPSGERSRLTTRPKAQGLLSGSCTPGTAGRGLQLNKFGYGPVPSNGKRSGNQVSHLVKGKTTTLKELNQVMNHTGLFRPRSTVVVGKILSHVIPN
jgi:hypothetical protein